MYFYSSRNPPQAPMNISEAKRSGATCMVLLDGEEIYYQRIRYPTPTQSLLTDLKLLQIHRLLSVLENCTENLWQCLNYSIPIPNSFADLKSELSCINLRLKHICKYFEKRRYLYISQSAVKTHL